MMLDRDRYRELIEARVFSPETLQGALVTRRRRSIPGTDGNLLILAADHTARGMLAASGDPLAVADRYTLLDRLVRAARVAFPLETPAVDATGRIDVRDDQLHAEVFFVDGERMGVRLHADQDTVVRDPLGHHRQQHHWQ